MNRKIIEWARKRSGYTVERLAVRMKREPAEIESWENGDVEPSYPVLEELAYTHLKIPVALFFFPSPPAVEDPIKKFRRLPQFELERLSPETYHLFRQAQSYQDSLRELLADAPSSRKIFSELRLSTTAVATLARSVREFLGITLDSQFAFRSSEQAFKAWRHAVELAGIYTFKNSFKDKFISGFCLHDDEYPVIMINNSTAFARQTFTLIHELAHILFHVSGVSDADDSYIGQMTPRERAIEVATNGFTAELLVPLASFNSDILQFQTKGEAAIVEIARKYSVSREVILRRLCDLGLVTAEEYRLKAGEWNKDFLRQYTKTGEGNYFATRMAYLGAGYTQLAFGKYFKGSLTKERLAFHLNVNAKHVDKLERYVTP
jgi:Zn-dependent peptidase ImmA (M78 family)